MIECEFCKGVNYESEEAIEIHYKNYHPESVLVHLKAKSFVEKMPLVDFVKEQQEKETKLVEKNIQEETKMIDLGLFGGDKKEQMQESKQQQNVIANRKVRIIAYCEDYTQVEELIKKVNDLAVSSKNKINIAHISQDDLSVMQDSNGEDYARR